MIRQTGLAKAEWRLHLKHLFYLSCEHQSLVSALALLVGCSLRSRRHQCVFVVIENASIDSRPHYNFDVFSTFLTDAISMRFLFDPLSKTLSNRCVFHENAQRISVDGRPERIEMYAFSNENLLAWTVPKPHGSPLSGRPPPLSIYVKHRGFSSPFLLFCLQETFHPMSSRTLSWSLYRKTTRQHYQGSPVCLQESIDYGLA